MNRNNFVGLSGFNWWVGVIVQRGDPLAQGRCKVRIFGWHTQDKSALSDDDLPWALPMLPINNPNVNGFGKPKVGDWVVGFFMDGESGQMPIMMGILPGFESKGT
jgi:hypothetical protein